MLYAVILLNSIILPLSVLRFHFPPSKYSSLVGTSGILTNLAGTGQDAEGSFGMFERMEEYWTVVVNY